MKRWAIIVLVFFVAVAAAWYLMRPGDHEAHFRRVQVGMSIAEVHEVLGPSKHGIGRTYGDSVERWSFYDGLRVVTIEVTLDENDRVREKEMTVKSRL